jgi:hypothetical protein
MPAALKTPVRVLPTHSHGKPGWRLGMQVVLLATCAAAPARQAA